jgi:hypothetical protein
MNSKFITVSRRGVWLLIICFPMAASIDLQSYRILAPVNVNRIHFQLRSKDFQCVLNRLLGCEATLMQFYDQLLLAV